MKMSKQTKSIFTLATSIRKHAIVLGAVGLAACSANAGTIFQTGTSGTTYTDTLGDGQGSANLLRDISSVKIVNDANNLIITLNINPAGNIATGGAFNYIIGITTGSPTAGGDTSANATTHGNAYTRAISFDSSFGGMTDFIGVFGAGGAGSVASPYTSYGYNDFVFGTPASTSPPGVWKNVSTVGSGQPISTPAGQSTPSSITLTVPMADFSANLALTPGTVIDFDVDSTGTSGNQTAYDSLATQGNIQGTFNTTAQFNETVLDQYTIAAVVPEPSVLALLSLGAVPLILFRRLRK